MNDAIVNISIAAVIAFIVWVFGGEVVALIAFALVWFCLGEGDRHRRKARAREEAALREWERR